MSPAQLIPQPSGVMNRTNHHPEAFSSGQQCMTITRLLLTAPAISPTSDPSFPLAPVTHDPKVAEKAQRIIHIQDGLVEEEPA